MHLRILKKSYVDPILVGGCLHRPQIKMGISLGPTTLKGVYQVFFSLVWLPNG